MSKLSHELPFSDGPEAVKESFASWAAHLGRVSAWLEEVAGSTENDFLAIGSRLHDFYRRAGDITQMSNDVVALVAGDEVADDIGRLHDILRVMGDYLSHADHESEAGSSTFATILDQLDKVVEPLTGFKKINKSLSMLGISTKIESARLGHSAAGFDTLANDVAKLSVQVIEKSDTILKHKDELSAVIRQTLLKVARSAVEQRQATRTIIDRTSGSLTMLQDVNSRCSSSATVISDVSSQVASSIGEVVTAMQFHDITRQQIEHVKETVDDLCARLSGPTHDPRELVGEVADLCELQVAQLGHAGEEFSGAITNIVGNLRGIVRQESHLSDQARGIAGVADTTGSSFFSDMERGLFQVTVALAQSVEENRNLNSAMNQVAGTVGNITHFVGDIEQIGEEIELIALNAQIKAAHTGDDGAALGVLAEAIQRLSHETRVHTTVVSDALRSITEFIDNLCRNMDEDASDMDSEVHTMEADLKRLLNSLRSINESLIALLGRMDAEVQSLSGDIELAAAGVSVQDSVMRVLEESVQVLEAVIAEARRIVPDSHPGGRAERLRQVAERYTMNSERKIHATLMGSTLGEETAAFIAGGADDAGGLGDNVELF